MCVTAAIRLPRDPETGKPEKDSKWYLFKIRDRAYQPTYEFQTYSNVENNEYQQTSLFVIDDDSDWTEGIRIGKKNHLMYVNSALNNSVDKKDGSSKGKNATEGKVADHGKTARRSLRTLDIDEAVEEFVEQKFDGCTLVSDGQRLFVIESSLPADIKQEIKATKTSGNIRSNADKDDYDTTVKEIKDEYLIVRTNHGIFDSSLGYQPKDGTDFKSSTNRQKIAYKLLNENVFKLSDFYHVMNMMDDEETTNQSEPYYRPYRNKLLVNAEKFTPVHSTSMFLMGLDPAMFYVKLIDADIASVNLNKIFAQEYPVRVTISG